MDWFNKKALMKAENELQRVKEELESTRDALKSESHKTNSVLFESQQQNNLYKIKVESMGQEIERLKAQLRGDRVCDGYCSLCKHGIKGTGFSPFIGNYPKWGCSLDCKCKDFEGKDG